MRKCRSAHIQSRATPTQSTTSPLPAAPLKNINFSLLERGRRFSHHYPIFRRPERMENGKILIIINQCSVCALWKFVCCWRFVKSRFSPNGWRRKSPSIDSVAFLADCRLSNIDYQFAGSALRGIIIRWNSIKVALGGVQKGLAEPK